MRVAKPEAGLEVGSRMVLEESQFKDAFLDSKFNYFYMKKRREMEQKLNQQVWSPVHCRYNINSAAETNLAWSSLSHILFFLKGEITHGRNQS